MHGGTYHGASTAYEALAAADDPRHMPRSSSFSGANKSAHSRLQGGAGAGAADNSLPRRATNTQTTGSVAAAAGRTDNSAAVFALASSDLRVHLGHDLQLHAAGVEEPLPPTSLYNPLLLSTAPEAPLMPVGGNSSHHCRHTYAHPLQNGENCSHHASSHRPSSLHPQKPAGAAAIPPGGRGGSSLHGVASFDGGANDVEVHATPVGGHGLGAVVVMDPHGHQDRATHSARAWLCAYFRCVRIWDVL